MTNSIILQNILKSNLCKQWTTAELIEEAKKENPNLRKESVCKIMKRLTKFGKVTKVRGDECHYVWN